jgi:hypothetical protein
MSSFSPLKTSNFRNQLSSSERAAATTTVRRRLIANADSIEIKAGDVTFDEDSEEPLPPPATMSPTHKSSVKLVGVDNKHHLKEKYSSYELKNKKVFDAIQLVKLQKSMLSVDTRISLARMGVEMIGTQSTS